MKLRLLHLEDSPEDVELIQRALSKEWPDCHTLVASDQAEFVDALRQGGFDLILGDYRIPGFDGLSALALARQHRPEIPFIFISGTMGEDLAVDALKTGAADY